MFLRSSRWVAAWMFTHGLLLPTGAASEATTVIDRPTVVSARVQTILGQTFTVPLGGDHVLSEFKLYGVAGGGDGGNADFSVVPWTGTAAGATLFSQSFSTTFLYPPLVIQTGNLDLTPGETYAAIITPLGSAGSGAMNAYESYHDGLGGSDYSGGHVIFRSFSSPTFRVDPSADLSFRATFVPEPASAALALVGFTLVTTMRQRLRRNRCKSNVSAS